MKTQTRTRVKSSLSPLTSKTTPSPFEKLKKLKKHYLSEGVSLIGVFGSYARKDEDIFSDIDIAYTINHDIFYKDDAFKKLLRLEEIKEEIELNLKKRVDLVSLNSNNIQFNNSIKKEMVKIWKIEST